jgi:transketolase
MDTPGPFYVRLGRLAVEDVYGAYGDEISFTLGKANTLREGNDVTLIGTGMMVQHCLQAADMLAAEGITARVLDMHTIKPIDADAIIKASKETGAIVTAEEHSIIGGLGGAVAEVLTESAPCIQRRIGVKDMFGQSGKPAELLELYNLMPIDIVKAAKEAIAALK